MEKITTNEKKKIHLQCGYEDECKHKDCLKCRKIFRNYNLKLSIAEQVVIEDFAVCDLNLLAKEKPEMLELMQDIARKIMKKMFKEERENDC